MKSGLVRALMRLDLDELRQEAESERMTQEVPKILRINDKSRLAAQMADVLSGRWRVK